MFLYLWISIYLRLRYLEYAFPSWLETMILYRWNARNSFSIYPYIASMLILRFTSRRGRVLKEQLSLKCFLQGVTRRNERTDGNENASHLTRETTSLARQTVVIQLLFEEDAIYTSATFRKKKKKKEGRNRCRASDS